MMGADSTQAYVNTDRPHQGIDQAIPERAACDQPVPHASGRVERIAVLGGLHHAYRHVA